MLHLKESIDCGGRVEGVDSADNMLLVATSSLGGNFWDASLRAIDLSTKKAVASIQQPCGCADVCWAWRGQRAVCAQDSGDVKVYKLEEDAPVRLVDVLTLQGHDDIVSSVAASRSHDGLVLSGSYDRSINVWDIDGDSHGSLDTFTGHTGGVTGVDWAAGQDDGQVFASSSTDCTVRVWDRRQAQTCARHRLGVPALSLSWEPCSQVLIAVGCEDGTLAILDKRNVSVPLSVQGVHNGRVNQTSFRPAEFGADGQHAPFLASVGDDGALAVTTVGDDSHHSRCTLHSDYIQGSTWCDGSSLVTGGWDLKLCMVDVHTAVSSHDLKA